MVNDKLCNSLEENVSLNKLFGARIITSILSKFNGGWFKYFLNLKKNDTAQSSDFPSLQCTSEENSSNENITYASRVTLDEQQSYIFPKEELYFPNTIENNALTLYGTNTAFDNTFAKHSTLNESNSQTSREVINKYSEENEDTIDNLSNSNIPTKINSNYAKVSGKELSNKIHCGKCYLNNVFNTFSREGIILSDSSVASTAYDQNTKTFNMFTDLVNCQSKESGKIRNLNIRLKYKAYNSDLDSTSEKSKFSEPNTASSDLPEFIIKDITEIKDIVNKMLYEKDQHIMKALCEPCTQKSAFFENSTNQNNSSFTNNIIKSIEWSNLFQNLQSFHMQTTINPKIFCDTYTPTKCTDTYYDEICRKQPLMSQEAADVIPVDFVNMYSNFTIEAMKFVLKLNLASFQSPLEINTMPSCIVEEEIPLKPVSPGKLTISNDQTRNAACKNSIRKISGYHELELSGNSHLEKPLNDFKKHFDGNFSNMSEVKVPNNIYRTFATLFHEPDQIKNVDLKANGSTLSSSSVLHMKNLNEKENFVLEPDEKYSKICLEDSNTYQHLRFQNKWDMQKLSSMSFQESCRQETEKNFISLLKDVETNQNLGDINIKGNCNLNTKHKFEDFPMKTADSHLPTENKNQLSNKSRLGNCKKTERKRVTNKTKSKRPLLEFENDEKYENTLQNEAEDQFEWKCRSPDRKKLKTKEASYAIKERNNYLQFQKHEKCKSDFQNLTCENFVDTKESKTTLKHLSKEIKPCAVMLNAVNIILLSSNSDFPYSSANITEVPKAKGNLQAKNCKKRCSYSKKTLKRYKDNFITDLRTNSTKAINLAGDYCNIRRSTLNKNKRTLKRKEDKKGRLKENFSNKPRKAKVYKSKLESTLKQIIKTLKSKTHETIFPKIKRSIRCANTGSNEDENFHETRSTFKKNRGNKSAKVTADKDFQNLLSKQPNLKSCEIFSFYSRKFYNDSKKLFEHDQNTYQRYEAGYSSLPDCKYENFFSLNMREFLRESIRNDISEMSSIEGASINLEEDFLKSGFQMINKNVQSNENLRDIISSDKINSTQVSDFSLKTLPKKIRKSLATQIEKHRYTVQDGVIHIATEDDLQLKPKTYPTAASKRNELHQVSEFQGASTRDLKHKRLEKETTDFTKPQKIEKCLKMKQEAKYSFKSKKNKRKFASISP